MYQHSLIKKHRHGFMKKKSTTLQLLKSLLNSVG